MSRDASHARQHDDDPIASSGDREVRSVGRGALTNALPAASHTVETKPSLGTVTSGLARRATEAPPRATGGAARPALPEGIARRAGGAPLPSGVAAEVSARMGVDLSSVRIHTGDAASEAARSVDARAFTSGNDIFFAAGEYDPTSIEGRRLLAHELAHVAQQRDAAGMQRKGQVSQPGDAAEAEADRAADALVGGTGPITVGESPAAVARKEAGPTPPASTASRPEPGSPEAKAAAAKARAQVELTQAGMRAVEQTCVELDQARAGIIVDAEAAKLAPILSRAELDSRRIDESATRALEETRRSLDEAKSAAQLSSDPELDTQLADLERVLPGLTANRERARRELDRAISDGKKRLEERKAFEAAEEKKKAAAEKVTTAATKGNKEESGLRKEVTDANGSQRLALSEEGDATVQRTAGSKQDDGSSSTTTVGVGVNAKEQRATVGGTWDQDDGKGTQSSSSGALGVDKNGVSLAGQTKTTTTDGKDQNANGFSGNMGYSFDGGFSGGASYTRERNTVLSPEEQKAADAKAFSDAREKAAGREPEKASGDKPKTEASSTSYNASLSFDKDKRGGTAGWSTNATGTDGVKSSTSTSGTVTSDGKTTSLGLDHGWTTGEKDDARSVKVSGGIEVDKHGRIIGSKGSITAGVGPRSVTVSGGYTAVINDPVQLPNGKWAVTWSTSLSGGLGADVKPGEGGGMGASVAGSASTAHSGQKVFDNMDGAVAFHAAGVLPPVDVPKRADQLISPTGELMLKEGEFIADVVGTSFSGGVSGSGGGFNIGATASRAVSSATKITGGKGGTVVVEVTVAPSHSLGASGGSALTVGGSYSVAESVSQTVSFNLTTSDGKRAFDDYRATGTVPKSGCVVLSTRTSHGEVKQVDIGLLGAKMSMGESIEKSTEIVGNDRIDTEKGSDIKGMAIPFLGKLDEQTSLSVIDVNQGKERYFSAEKSVKSSNADDARQGLLGAIGAESDQRKVSGQSSGDWKVSWRFSEKQMSDFMSKVNSGVYDARGLQGSKASWDLSSGRAGTNLKEALAKAGSDKAAQREALARFVAEGGDKALSQIRDYTGASPEYFVELTGDKSFSGLAGRIELEGKMAAFESRATDTKTDLLGLSREIRLCIAEQRGRIASLDPSRYPDLPAPMRAMEVSRTEGDIAKLEALTKTVHARLEAAALRNATSVDPRQRLASDPNEKGLPAAIKRLYEREEAMREAKGRAETVYKSARVSRWVHDGGDLSSGKSRTSSARDMLDGRIVFGLVEAPEKAAYARADVSFTTGQMLIAMARTTEVAFLTMPFTTDGEIESAVGIADRGKDLFEKARTELERAENVYQEIAKRNPGQGYFRGYDKGAPDGV